MGIKTKERKAIGYDPLKPKIYATITRTSGNPWILFARYSIILVVSPLESEGRSAFTLRGAQRIGKRLVSNGLDKERFEEEGFMITEADL